jgi:hypothetical protein
MNKTTKISWFTGAVAIAAGTVSPSLAHALTCGTNLALAPVEGDVGVPTDALLWGYGGSSSTRLLGPGGEVVPTDDRAVPIAVPPVGYYAMGVLAPLEPLTPNTSYTVEVDHNAGSEDAPPFIELVHFTTGAGPTSAPPPVPVLVDSLSHAGAGFYQVTRAVELKFEHQGILIGDTGGLGAVSSVEDLFYPGTIPTEDDDTRRIEWATTTGFVWVGKGDCSIWPEGASDRENARFGVLDIAGNFSGWMETEIELPSEAEAQAQVALAEQERAAEQASFYPPQPVSNTDHGYCNIAPGAAPTGAAAGLTLALAGLLAGRRLRRSTR